MKKSPFKSTMITMLTLLLSLSGCSSNTTSSTTTTQQQHPTLTMTTRVNTNYEGFIEALHEVYPEINIELISYRGNNSTQYNTVQLQAGDISDIFLMSYPPSQQLQQDNLYDISGEDFVSNINLKTVSDLSLDGALYLLPTSMAVYGIYYNKTLFEKNGWSVPTSMQELEELIPQIEAAGVKLAENTTELMGGPFETFFSFNGPDYFSSLEMISWMKEFTQGSATATGNIEEVVENYQHYIDIGLLNIGETPTQDSETFERFCEGNTAFLVTIRAYRTTQNEDGSGDQYGIMPYLSKDGSNNIIMTNVNFYVGISKKVAEDENKLADALKVMEFLSTPQGQAAIENPNNKNTLSPLKNSSVEQDSLLYEASLLVDEGKYMSFVYNNWEDYVVSIGENAFAMTNGEMSGEEFIEALDALQETVNSSEGLPALATVERDLEKQEVAQLVGAAYASATGADCALISIGDYHGDGQENQYGINGKIYASVPLIQDNISTFNPLGASKNIKTVSLTGAQINQWVQEGYIHNDDPTPFEYVLVTKQGKQLEDDKTYTVAISYESETRSEEGNLVETDVNSQAAIEDYLLSIKTINDDTLIWK